MGLPGCGSTLLLPPPLAPEDLGLSHGLAAFLLPKGNIRRLGQKAEKKTPKDLFQGQQSLARRRGGCGASVLEQGAAPSRQPRGLQASGAEPSEKHQALHCLGGLGSHTSGSRKGRHFHGTLPAPGVARGTLCRMPSFNLNTSARLGHHVHVTDDKTGPEPLPSLFRVTARPFTGMDAASSHDAHKQFFLVVGNIFKKGETPYKI